MNGTLNVMLFYDNPDDRAFIMRELNREFRDCQFKPVTSLREYQEAVTTARWDVVLTDHALRWSDGITMSRAVKDRQPECLVIMFTGTGNEEIAVQAMKSGLDDYVSKPVRIQIGMEGQTRLGSAVQLALERVRSQRAVREAELHYQRLFDDAPVGLFRVSPAGQIVDGNPALAELLHFPNLDLLRAANLFSLFVQAEKRKEFQESLKLMRVIRHFEARLCCCDDQIICAGTHARPVQVSPEGGVFYEGSLEDITERKAGEKQLRERLEQLQTVSEDLVALREEESKDPAVRNQV